MLRREFFKAVAGFAAASATVRSLCVGEDGFRAAICGDKAALTPIVQAAVDTRSQFEQVIVSCLRDGSLRCLGVSGSGRGYDAGLVSGEGAESPTERGRLESVLGLYDRGVVYIERVTEFNGYSGISITFGVCAS